MIILRSMKNISSLNLVASVLLFVTAILAAVVANSSLAPAYNSFLSHELHLRIGDFNLFSHGGHPLTMLQFINDCLMTDFAGCHLFPFGRTQFSRNAGNGYPDGY